jgi:hypothetical protein
MDTETLWSWIEASVYDLPHKIEWQEGGRTLSVMHTMCVVPNHIVVLFAQAFDLYGRCEDLARKRQCKFFKSNDGSYVFEKR